MIEELLQQIYQREQDAASYKEMAETQARECKAAADKSYDEVQAKAKAWVKDDRAARLQQAQASAQAAYEATMAATEKQCADMRLRLEPKAEALADELLGGLMSGNC